MRIHESIQGREPGNQTKAGTVSQEEAERAGKLYQKFLNYSEGLGGNPWNPPTEEEMKFLTEYMGRMEHRVSSRRGESE